MLKYPSINRHQDHVSFDFGKVDSWARLFRDPSTVFIHFLTRNQSEPYYTCHFYFWVYRAQNHAPGT
jgi:hypothetical protein